MPAQQKLAGGGAGAAAPQHHFVPRAVRHAEVVALAILPLLAVQYQQRDAGRRDDGVEHFLEILVIGLFARHPQLVRHAGAYGGQVGLLREVFQTHGFRRDADAVHGDIGADPGEADGGNAKNDRGGVLSFHGPCFCMSCAAVILPGQGRWMV